MFPDKSMADPQHLEMQYPDITEHGNNNEPHCCNWFSVCDVLSILTY